MKLLFDENLSPALSVKLQEIYPDCRHVHDCQLGSADDGEIWDYALNHGYVIVSKDTDFIDRSLLYGAPPQIIQIRLGNCSTVQIIKLLSGRKITIEHFFQSEDDYLIIP